MPGVVMMENGVQNGLPTNHDRDTNGAINGDRIEQPAGAGAGPGIENGGSSFLALAESSAQQNGTNPSSTGGQAMANGDSSSSRMNDLPDEIQHITEGYIPLGLLLSRLAQKTHNRLQEKILELAKMPAPNPTLNGNSARPSTQVDDVSVENLSKKESLLHFVQNTHADWTKALIIAAWSRRAPTVSKLLDLKDYIEKQRDSYGASMNYLMNVKRDLAFARLPNPDLRTALQVLSTGEAPWMPDLNFIEPPPLSLKEQLKWVEEINTLLSLRLNLEDHDKIPLQFRDYSIDSGRVKFRVEGEFEVDLTIADEDFEKQFWFIDFRFLFTPAPAELTDLLRLHLETRVNEVLEKDGLQGCYNFLHEFVLTHKITEFVRQARELGRGRWVDTLKVERLNRAMSIQYWANRLPAEGPKSWLILGVHSGKKPGVAKPGSTSYLTLRWFKDNKEVKDAAVTFDDGHISTETLLKKVIAQHVGHILSTIYGKLKTKGRFVRREAALSLHISPDDPVQSALKMQLNHDDAVTLQVAPINGFFSITPQTPLTYKAETNLNWQSKDPVEEGLGSLEGLRYRYILEKIYRRGFNTGWVGTQGPVKAEEVKSILKTNEQFYTIWLKKTGWPPGWHLLLRLSLSGDKWYLIEVVDQPKGPRIATHTELLLTLGLPDFNDKFFSSLDVFSAAMISQIVDLKVIHQKQIKYLSVKRASNASLPPSVKLPTLFLRLTDLLRTRQPHGAGKISSWAQDYVQVMFKGIRTAPAKPPKALLTAHNTPGAQDNNNNNADTAMADEDRLIITVDARVKVVDRSKFSLLTGNVERDVAFNPRLGVFALRLETGIGRSILDSLAHRIQAIERLVDCVDAIRRSSADIKCESITLAKIVFTYSDAIGRSHGTTAEASIHRWKASLDLRKDRIKMSLEKGNPHLRTLDRLNDLLNSNLGFAKVPQYLAFTLPVLKALDAVEDAWQELETNNQGRVEVFSRHLDWYNIRYTIPGPNKGALRQLNVEIRLRDRRGELSWFVARHEPGPVGNPEDEFKQVLNQVWESKDRQWTSFLHSAACDADDRIATLLKAVDAAIRPLATKVYSPSVSRQVPAKSQPQQKMQGQGMNQRMQQGNKPRPQQVQQGNVVVLDD